MSTPFNYLAAPSQLPLENRGKIRNILGGKHWIWCLMTMPHFCPNPAQVWLPVLPFPSPHSLWRSSSVLQQFLVGIRGGFVCPTAAVNHSKGLGISKHWLNPVWEHLYAALPLLNLGICSLEKSSCYFNLDIWNETLLNSAFWAAGWEYSKYSRFWGNRHWFALVFAPFVQPVRKSCPKWIWNFLENCTGSQSPRS